jgi:deoxyguanosine kinase
MANQGHIRIEICGGIASGKTTLCNLFTETTLTRVIEKFEDNPFWSLFYQNPQEHSFETEITFLLQHYSQVKQANAAVICDFSLLQDLSYAQINLKGERLATFRTVYRQVSRELPKPALIIRLECSAKTELKRISQRQRQAEQSVHASYLSALNRAIARNAARVSQTIPVTTIDSDVVDFENDDAAKRQVVADILSTLCSRVKNAI